jgi:hypothetical protein
MCSCIIMHRPGLLWQIAWESMPHSMASDHPPQRATDLARIAPPPIITHSHLSCIASLPLVTTSSCFPGCRGAHCFPRVIPRDGKAIIWPLAIARYRAAASPARQRRYNRGVNYCLQLGGLKPSQSCKVTSYTKIYSLISQNFIVIP